MRNQLIKVCIDFSFYCILHTFTFHVTKQAKQDAKFVKVIIVVILLSPNFTFL